MKVFISFDMEGVAGIVDFHRPPRSISGTPSVLSHTYNPSVISRVSLNGVECGEPGLSRYPKPNCRPASK